MSSVLGVDRLRVARLVAARGMAGARRAWGRALRPIALARLVAPQRLLIAPQDIRATDPTVADDIYAGFYSFAGKVANTHGDAPFAIDPPSEAWSAALTGFGWLRHLRAAGTPLARANARALVADWLATHDRPSDRIEWRTDVVARRLLSWLGQSPMILEAADRAFYRAFMRSIGRHAAALRNDLSQGLFGEDRLRALIALATLGLCAEGVGSLQRASSRLLALELSRQILPDGGHIGRNPRTIVKLLLDLVPLRQAYAARGLAAPPQLLNAIDRMLPHLRMLRLGDGSLGLFNGMGVTVQNQLASALAHGDGGLAATLDAPYSGYQRLEAESTVLVMDTGAPPPPRFSRHAHAGCLSFEFSSRGQRMVVNCGAPGDARDDLREAARATAAHSTLVIDDTSSARVAPPEGFGASIAGWIIAGPRHVEAERFSDDNWVGVEASHDGYAATFGVTHRRLVRISRDGLFLQGEDRLEPDGDAAPAEHAYAIRFHLHPGALATLADDAKSAVVGLPGGDSWLFQAGGLPLTMEDSVYFANVDRARATGQLVIHGDTLRAPMAAWSFERLN